MRFAASLCATLAEPPAQTRAFASAGGDHRHDGGRYMFTVNPHDYIFTWDYGHQMSGKLFLKSSSKTKNGG
jgi:hypothetical protein